MNCKAQSQIIGGIIVGIAIVIAGFYFSNIQNPPRPIIVVQPGTTEFCPASLYFSSVDYSTSFNLNYLNSGDHDADFAVSVSSKDVLSKYSSDILSNYTLSTTKGWFVTKGSYQQFTFQLKLNDSSQQPDNIIVFATMKCSYSIGSGSLQTNLGCGSFSTCCFYTKSGFATYNFDGEKCS